MRRYTYLLVGLVSTLIFGELGFFVKDGPTPLDSTIAEWFKVHRTPAEVRFAEVFNAFTAPALVLILAVVLLLFRQYRMHAWYLLDFAPLALLVGTGGVATVAKFYFDRLRPGAGLSINFDLEPSFPSGHVAFIAVTCGCLLLIYSGRRALVITLTLLITAFSGFERLLVGAHWFTDVLGSVFMAVGIFFLIKYIEELLVERERAM